MRLHVTPRAMFPPQNIGIRMVKRFPTRSGTCVASPVHSSNHHGEALVRRYFDEHLEPKDLAFFWYGDVQLDEAGLVVFGLI